MLLFKAFDSSSYKPAKEEEKEIIQPCWFIAYVSHAIYNFFTRIFIRCLSEAQNFSGPTVSKHEYFVIDDCNTDNRTQVAMKTNDCS